MRRKTATATDQVDFERLELDARQESGLHAFRVRVEFDYWAYVVAPTPESARRASLAFTAANLPALLCTGYHSWEGGELPRTSALLHDRDLETAVEDIREGETYQPLVISADAPAHEDWPEYLKTWQANALTPIERDPDRCQRAREPLPLVSQPVQWREPSYTDRERAILAACEAIGDPVGVLNLARELATNTAILGDMIAAPGWKEDDAEYEGRIARQTDLACALMVAVEGGKTPDVKPDLTLPEKLAA